MAKRLRAMEVGLEITESEIMRDPDTVKLFRGSNLDPVVSSAAQTRERLAAYRKQWEPVIRESGYRP